MSIESQPPACAVCWWELCGRLWACDPGVSSSPHQPRWCWGSRPGPGQLHHNNTTENQTELNHREHDPCTGTSCCWTKGHHEQESQTWNLPCPWLCKPWIWGSLHRVWWFSPTVYYSHGQRALWLWLDIFFNAISWASSTAMKSSTFQKNSGKSCLAWSSPP